MRQDEVTDLDDLPLAVEVVERGAADNLAAAGIDGGQRQQSPFLGENGEILDRGGKGVTIEGRKVSCLTHLRVDKRRKDRIHVVLRREAEDDVAGTEPVGWHRQAHGRLARR